MADRPLLLSAYRSLLGLIGTPVGTVLLRRREKQGKELAERLGERRGRAGLPRPDGRLIWVHAASVGEFNSVQPLLAALADRGFAVLLTTGTVSSARLAADRLPPGVVHQFVPLDVPSFVRRFLDHWQPDLVLFTESELWPVMLGALAGREVPVVIVNARLSDRSMRRWSRAKSSIGYLLDKVDLCLAQSEGDAERLRALGAHRVQNAGNLKFDVPPPEASAEALARVKSAMFGRRVLLAASTHPGESEDLVAVHTGLKETVRNLLTVIAPRHPGAADSIKAAADEAGLLAVRRSEKPEPAYNTDIFIVDTIGELGLFYRSADLVFVGGSLVPHGGQNPIEPAKLGVPILHGPSVHNFVDIYAALDMEGGAVRVETRDRLAEATARLFSATGERDAMREAANGVVQRHAGALERTLNALEPYLMQMSLSR
jgi:3-deoxy-D-manno-octulosonic-acid transferase